MKKYINRIVIIAIIAITTISAKAQFNIGGPGTNGSGTNANGTGNGAPTVPFDGGMSLMLLVSGIGYSAKKVGKRKINQLNGSHHQKSGYLP